MTKQETTNSVREDFAQRLRTLRKDAGFKTARMFASTLQIDENRYTRYERAEVEPDLGLIAKFCDVLGITPNELLGFDASHAFPDARSNAPLGFAESEQAAYGEMPSASAVGSSSATAPYDDRVRAAIWQLADASARVDAGGQSEAVTHLRKTATIYEEILKDPLGYVARAARRPELERASRSEQEALASAVNGLVELLKSSTG